MSWRTVFALLSLGPAALTATVPAAMAVSAPTCAGGYRVAIIPFAPGAPAREGTQPCCAKGCHTGGSRKRRYRCC
ncbi:hypothetical protein KRR38_30825 [Novosphingobium sp. G106]|uniref:hypothetical protein n=1 Tax=Novosphingobium sp. G106 TaxID=2849500 RepID=UPI001C2D01DF|nr:hypothetical protein [Novosphingobium sp. G106]MBV1691943.1 hypothetical protein [Novosphingobium sp. G106]